MRQLKCANFLGALDVSGEYGFFGFCFSMNTELYSINSSS